MTPKRHLLYWGYIFHHERDFKELRERRTKFRDELMKDAREAGMIK